AELWDTITGERLAVYPSKPFDVHAAWLPDGKHFLTGLDIIDKNLDILMFEQSLGLWRRPDVSPSPGSPWSDLERSRSSNVSGAGAGEGA
ncbi:unnamed protein product, partial [Discosporangium mesarthrocarpum]